MTLSACRRLVTLLLLAALLHFLVMPAIGPDIVSVAASQAAIIGMRKETRAAREDFKEIIPRAAREDFSFATCKRGADVQARICQFTSVCWDRRDRDMVYFMNPSEPLPLVGGPGGMERIYDEQQQKLVDLPLAPPHQHNTNFGHTPQKFFHVRYEAGPIPWSSAVLHDRLVHVMFDPNLSDNRGHAFGDILLSVFSLLKHSGFEEDAEVAAAQFIARGLGRTISDLKYFTIYVPLLSDHPIIDIDADEMFSSPPTGSAADARYVCLPRLLVGAGAMGASNDKDSASWPAMTALMLRRAVVAWKQVRDAAVAIPNRQSITLMVQGGRHAFTNFPESEAYLRRVFPDVEILAVDHSTLSFEEQITLAQRTTVLVAPYGGASYFSAFMRVGASAVYFTYWDPVLNRSVNMDAPLWSHDWRITDHYYDVKEAEAQPGRGKKTDPDVFTHAAVTINPRRLARVVLSALQQAEHRLHLPSPSFRAQFQDEYADA